MSSHGAVIGTIALSSTKKKIGTMKPGEFGFTTPLAYDGKWLNLNSDVMREKVELNDINVWNIHVVCVDTGIFYTLDIPAWREFWQRVDPGFLEELDNE